MKKQIIDWTLGILFLASIIGNFALYGRWTEASETRDEYFRMKNRLEQQWQNRYDSIINVHKENRANIKSESKHIETRSTNDKKDIRKTDSIVRHIGVNKLDSLWKLTGIDQMP